MFLLLVISVKGDKEAEKAYEEEKAEILDGVREGLTELGILQQPSEWMRKLAVLYAWELEK